MLILAFDTTVASCSVALWRDGKSLRTEYRPMKNGQAEALIPLIEGIMNACDTSYSDLDRIAVTLGPGSFTGVRVGIATARAIGLAAEKPLVGIATTEVYAAAAPEENKNILTAIDTKRGDLYVQIFDTSLKSLSNIEVTTIGELPKLIGPDPVTVVGDAALAVTDVLGESATLSDAPPFPDVALLAKLSSTRTPEPRDIAPIYARAPEIGRPR